MRRTPRLVDANGERARQSSVSAARPRSRFCLAGHDAIRADFAVRFSAMGLDGVELVMEIEEEFGIELSDDEAGPVETVGQIIQLVESKLSPESRQQLGPAFYRLRQVLADSVLIDKRLIRPDTDLRPFIPATQIAGVWDDLRSAGFSVPDLALSRFGVVVFLTFWFGGMLAAFSTVSLLTGSGALGATAGVTMFLLGWIPILLAVLWLSRAVAPSLCAIPTSCCTAGALARRWSGMRTERTAETDNSRVVAPARECQMRESAEAGDATSDDAALADRAFDQLKEIVREVTGGADGDVAASTRIEDLVPRQERWALYDALKRRGARVVPLQLNVWVRAIIALPVLVLALALVAATLWAMLILVDAGWFGAAALTGITGLTAAVLFASAAHKGLAAFARTYRLWWLASDIPKEWRTLGDAARWLAEHGWPYTPTPFTIHSRSVAIRVRQVVAELASAPVERIAPDTRLVDLGI